MSFQYTLLSYHSYVISTFFVPVSCQFRFGRRQGCPAEPFPLHQLPYPAGHKESRLRRMGNSEACNRKGESCWWLSKKEGAAPAPVSGETLPLWGAGPLRWGEFDWGTLLRSPTPAESVAVFHSSVVVEHVPAQYECRFPLDARTGTRRRRVQTLRFFSVCSCGWTYV